MIENLKHKERKMPNNILVENETKLGLVVNIKSELEKKKLLTILPHNLSMLEIGLTGLIAETNENKQLIYRSKERINLIELDNLKIQITCEEYSYFLGVCSFLNDYKMDYEIDSDSEYIIKECAIVNPDNIDEILDSIDD